MYKLVLILFLIGHILGDFYFQSSDLAKNKDKLFQKLLIHGIIYAISIFLVIIPIFSFDLIIYVIIIAISHFIVDYIKFLIKKKYKLVNKKEFIVYSTDQVIHILIIVLTSVAMKVNDFQVNFINPISYILNKVNIDLVSIFSWILAVLIIVNPCIITIKKVLYGFKSMTKDEGKPNAGTIIGVLERCIVLLLLTGGQYSAIGFVLTAKSIARYKKITDDSNFAEYYLIGTLLSNMLAILTYILIFK